MNKHVIDSIHQSIDELIGKKEDYFPFLRKPLNGAPMPSLNLLGDMMDALMEVFFPSYFGKSDLSPERLHHHIGNKIFDVAAILHNELLKGFCFECADECHHQCNNFESQAQRITAQFVESLANIKKKLNSDVYAAYNGDPAAKSYGEIIFCYPSIRCMIFQRVAHSLYRLGTPLIPRILTEMAHSQTGIDIHPGAEIGEYFTIDHGTGVVIGETCIIGEKVKIYQGVTLGAKSFPLDENGNPIKGIERHPLVGNNVIIYANATILGRIKVGDNSIISANAWITKDVAPDTKIII